MAQQKYYPEEILVEKMQSGEYSWLDYVNHYSAEWQEEYADYCADKGLTVGEDSAAAFVPSRTDSWRKPWNAVTLDKPTS